MYLSAISGRKTTEALTRKTSSDVNKYRSRVNKHGVNKYDELKKVMND